MNSRKYLPAVFVCLVASFSLQAQTIDVTTLGARPDGSNPTATAQAFYNALNSYPHAKIVVPPGIYSIDNSTGSIYAGNFSGELEFRGGAQLVFLSPVYGGLRFVGGTGARIRGLHGSYPTMPVTRTEEEFSFTSMNDLTIDDAIAQNSPGMGFLFTLCVRPKASNITVSHALADGLAFANSQNAQLTNYTAEYAVDNGLAFYNYSYLSDWNGATASGIHVVQTLQAHAIAVAGTSDVMISDFIIDTTNGSAIWVSQDPVYQTRVANNVIIQDGLIENAGVLAAPGINNFAIEYTNSDNVLFADIRIDRAATRAVTGLSPNGHIRLHGVRATNNLSADAFVMGITAFVEMVDCTSEGSPQMGFSFNGVKMLIARDLKVINASSQSSMNRAIWFENGAFLTATNLSVIDDRATPAGFVVGTSDSGSQIQNGSIEGVTSAITNGKLVFNQLSPRVHVSNVN